MQPLSKTIHSCDIVFAGHCLSLDAAGALYWPEQEMLIVSDLHLEKGSFLARFGSALPQYDTRDTLQRLQGLLAHYQPRQVVCLGDSFHDKHAYLRLPQEERQFLHDLVGQIDEWHWILGNHDAAFPEGLPGKPTHHLWIEELILAHELHAPDASHIIGHYHPKARLSLGGHRVSGKCFMVAERLLIMPSFGSYTGGLDSEDEALLTLSSSPFRRFMMYRDKLWKL